MAPLLGRKIGPAFLGLPESHKDTGRGGLQRPRTVPGSQEEAGRPPAASWPGCRFQPGKENFLKRNDSPGRRPRRGSRAPRELRRDLHIRLPPERVFLLNWPPGFPNRKVELTGNLGPPCALGSEGDPESASTSRPPALGGAVGRAAREMRTPRDTPPPKAAGTPPSLSPNPGLPALTSPSSDPRPGFLPPARDQFLRAEPKASLGFPRALRRASAPRPDTP